VVGPELGLDQNDERGIEQAEVAAEDEAEVEGEVEDGFLAEAGAGELLAGASGGGDDDFYFRAGESGTELEDEGGDGENFSDRDGVDPNGGVAGAEFAECGGGEAETLGDSGAMARGKEQQQEPERQPEDGGESEGDAVEGVHAGWAWAKRQVPVAGSKGPIRWERGFTGGNSANDNGRVRYKGILAGWVACGAMLAGSLAGGFMAGAQATPPAAQKAESYPAVDVHDKEQVSVAGDPLDTKAKEAIFKIDYLKAGFMPVRLIVTNNSDTAIKLDDARIYFVTADGQKIRAAEPENVERRVQDLKDPTKRMETPYPFKGLGKPKSKDPQVQADFKLADFVSLTVAPHSTQSGYLFFDVNDVEKPLAGGKLLVREVKDADGTELFYFEAPFDKYLAAKK
jgi:hypothetical protein